MPKPKYVYPLYGSTFAVQHGLTLLEHAYIQAMQGIVSAGRVPIDSPKIIAELACDVAEAMVTEMESRRDASK